MNEDEEKESIDIKFSEHKADTENCENANNFKWSDVQREDDKDIAKVSLIESLQKQANKQKFINKVTGILFDDYGIVSKKRKI